ncbi:four-helix bundle copper-binding protein, partial [Pseudomonas aeruginosa]|uniref:four-helix bundle copper-binding protein n=1 Tax=Pseudomonas aeruginosa TaxID=287 RepID=UPI001CA5EF31
ACNLFNLFFFQAEDGIRDVAPSRGLGDVYKRQALACAERCDGDEPLERECAGACRRFVEACRPLLPA